MNRVVAHLIGWASLAVGCALVAMVVLVPPWLELHYSQWERDWMQACARTQAEQVEAYEHFASALNSNDPVLLQRLAHHHLRLKPSQAQLISLPRQITGDMDLYMALDPDIAALEIAEGPPPQIDPRSSLIEQWLHKPYPVVGIDHPAYETPDHMIIRLSTGPKRIVLLAMGGLFMLCGLLMPGLPQVATAEEMGEAEDDEYVTAEIDDEDVDAFDDSHDGPLQAPRGTVSA